MKKIINSNKQVLILCMLLAVFSQKLIAQTSVRNNSFGAGDANKIYTNVQVQAEYKGGMKEFYAYIGQKMTYPFKARRMGVEGKVYVQFIVEPDGRISNVKTIRGIGAGCDEEAMNVIKRSPRWNPGKQNGKPVRVKKVIPITFRLN